MKLIVENLGPIKSAEIDISKRFIVFVGYNNTGKTYLSQLIWALYDRELIRMYVEKHHNDHQFEFNEEGILSISQKRISDIVASFSTFLVSDLLPIIFNVQHDHTLLKDCKIRFDIDFDKIKSFELKQTVGFKSKDENIEILKLEKIENELKIKKTENKFKKAELPEEIFEIEFAASKLILDFLVNVIFVNTHSPFYLPATRLFYPVFYQYIYGVEKEKREEMSRRLLEFLENAREDIIQKLELSEFTSFRSPYTRPMNALINRLYKMNEKLKIKNNYAEVASVLQEMMGGEVIMKKTEGIAPIEFFLKTEDNTEIDMYISSSSVNQLTTLYFYFKFWIREQRNYLFLDEPEENLHPKYQEKVLNLLMNYLGIGKDNRLLLTTHSTIVADVINNYVNLSRLKQKKKDIALDLIKKMDLDLNIDTLLNPDDIGIYFFSHDNVVEYSKDEYGIHFKDFVNTRNKILRDSELITDQLYAILENEDN